MSLADSILQTASMTRWVSVAVTATNQAVRSGPCQHVDPTAAESTRTWSTLAGTRSLEQNSPDFLQEAA